MSLWGYFDKRERMAELARRVADAESAAFEELQRSHVPRTFMEFKVSPYYVLKSNIRKYEGVRPGAHALDIRFREEEDVYLRKDIVELHSDTRWKKMGRKVRPGEKAVK
jgi:hypothetical protein